MKLYVFRTVPLPIITSLFTVYSAMVYVIQVCRQLSSLWHIPVPSVQWINSWQWAEELPETCRVSCRSKFRKLVHLVGIYYKEICYDVRSQFTMHGHMKVKLYMIIAKPGTFSNRPGFYSLYFNAIDYSISLEHELLCMTLMKKIWKLLIRVTFYCKNWGRKSRKFKRRKKLECDTNEVLFMMFLEFVNFPVVGKGSKFFDWTGGTL
jgi:hypothetical protein